MALPHDVERKHILKALEQIHRLGIASIPGPRRIRKYELRYDGNRYPPKYVICLSHKFVDGTEFESVFSGGDEANNFLIDREFEIWDVSRMPPVRVGIQAVSEDEEKIFSEGGVRGYRLHKALERNAKIARAAKEKRLKETGDLACDACGFSFRAEYGPLGVGYIEAHHTIPIAAMKRRRLTKLNEIVLVCSNCHRILHRNWPLSVTQLKHRIEMTRTSL
jgi:hypothetical protein